MHIVKSAKVAGSYFSIVVPVPSGYQHLLSLTFDEVNNSSCPLGDEIGRRICSAEMRGANGGRLFVEIDAAAADESTIRSVLATIVRQLMPGRNIAVSITQIWRLEFGLSRPVSDGRYWDVCRWMESRVSRSRWLPGQDNARFVCHAAVYPGPEVVRRISASLSTCPVV